MSNLRGGYDAVVLVIGEPPGAGDDIEVVAARAMDDIYCSDRVRQIGNARRWW